MEKKTQNEIEFEGVVSYLMSCGLTRDEALYEIESEYPDLINWDNAHETY